MRRMAIHCTVVVSFIVFLLLVSVGCAEPHRDARFALLRDFGVTDDDDVSNLAPLTNVTDP